MKTPIRLLCLLLLCLPIAACLDIETLISVRGDGSGTVRERVHLSDEAVEMIRQMEQTAGGKSSGTGVLDRARLEARSAAMGPGVALVSAEPLPAGEGTGYVALWSFDDIDTLRVEQDPEGAMPSGDDAAGGSTEADKASMRFRLQRGETPVLHVASSLARDPASAATAGSDVPTPPAEEQVPAEILREMFKGMRFEIAIEVEGGIVETNATRHDGRRVTVFELDFDRLLQNDEALALLGASDQPDPTQVMAALRDVPGIHVETEPDLRIAFAPSAEGTGVAGAEATAPVAAMAPETATPAAAAPVPAPPEPVAAMAPETATPAAATPVPAPSEPSAAAPVPAPPAMPSTTVDLAPLPARPLPSGSIAGYAWRPVGVEDIERQLGKLVSITDSDGIRTKGLLVTVEAGRVRLRRASVDGGGTVEMPLGEVRELDVFEQGG